MKNIDLIETMEMVMHFADQYINLPTLPVLNMYLRDKDIYISLRKTTAVSAVIQPTDVDCLSQTG